MHIKSTFIFQLIIIGTLSWVSFGCEETAEERAKKEAERQKALAAQQADVALQDKDGAAGSAGTDTGLAQNVGTVSSGSETAGTSNGTLGNGDGGSTASSPIQAQSCNGQQVLVRRGECPENYAVYALQNTIPAALCCPLPSNDIIQTGSKQARRGNCNTDEIMIGLVGKVSLICASVNSAKYRVGSAQGVCEIQQQSQQSRPRSRRRRTRTSSADSSSSCNLPSSLSSQLTAAFKGTGCAGVPFGSVVSTASFRSCQSTQFSLIFDRTSNQALVMHP